MIRFRNLIRIEARGNFEISKENKRFQKRRKQSETMELSCLALVLSSAADLKEDYIHGVPVPESCRVSGPNIPNELGMVPVGFMLVCPTEG